MKYLLLLAWLIMPAGAQALVVLQYHHISNSTPAATSVSPARFAEHMAAVRESGYRVLSLAAVAATLRAGQPLPDKAVLITFDDAYDSIYHQALPVLQHYGWPFVVFVSPGPVDLRVRGMMSWDQLRALAKAGAAIANHSQHHNHLVRRLPDESEADWRARLRAELLTAEARIEAETGHSHRALAYPYGEYSAPVLALVAELGFIGFGQQSGGVRPDEPQIIARFPFGGPYGELADFRLKLRTLPLPFSARQLTDDQGRPLDSLLPPAARQPRLLLDFADPGLARQLTCFASGQGPARVAARGNQVEIQAERPLAAGRSRYNCTAPSAEPGRFYWYSEAFIRPNRDGSWPAEP